MLYSPGPFNPKELVEKVEKKKTPAASPCPVAMVPSHATSSPVPVCDGLRRSVRESVFVCVSRPAFDDAGCC